MKNDVDKRVVEYEFDNRNFDKNVKKSEKTLRNFEETLQFKDVSKSLDVIKMKFSTMEIVMASTIRNITDRVVNLGIRLVKSLSVDNLTAGWQKFGEKTIAVGTLMSQSLKIAGKEIEDYSEKMEVVNDQLDKLNWFTDETSYNFTDMVDNIGKFTAAGQDLDKSVEAMMGIANWAALSGQNAATASRAMYQLSQALGKGYVQLIDYKSIQNANMDTQEFRKTVLETAVAMGELTKEGQDYLTKTGKKFSQNQFAEQLNAKWFTSDVLTASLKKYSSAVDKLYEITEKEGITASEAIKLYGDQFEDLGIKAFKAAQEARTFSDAINSVKDAVSTGWMTTAEMIFGSYDEAKEFWTQLANELYDVFAESGNIRNEILAIWKALEGRSDLFKRGGSDQGAFWNLYDSIIAVRDAFSNAWNIIFPKTEFEEEADQVNDIAHNLKTFTSNLQKSTARVKEFFETNEDLQQILEGVFSLVKVFVSTLEALRYALDPVVYALKQIALSIANIFADLGRQLSSSTGYAEILLNAATKISEVLTNIFQTINLPKVLEKVVSILKILVNYAKNIVGTISNFIDNHVDFGKLLKTISSGLSTLTKNIKSFFSEIRKGFSKTKGNSIVNSIIGGESNKSLKDTNDKNTETLNILQALKDFANALLRLLKVIYKATYSAIVFATSLLNVISEFIESLANKILKIADAQDGTNKALKTLLKVVGGALVAFAIFKIIIEFVWMFEYMKGNIFSTLDDAADALRKWGRAKTIESIGYTLKSLAVSFAIVVAALHFLKDVSWKELAKGGAILAVMATAVFLLSKNAKKVNSSFNLLKKNEGFLSGTSEADNLYSIASLIKSFGLAMVMLAASAAIFNNVKPEAFDNFMIVFAIMIGIIAAVAYFSKDAKGEVASAKQLLPTMFQFLGFAIALRSIINTLLYVTEELSKMTAKMRWGFIGIVAAFSIILGSILAIVGIVKKGTQITNTAKSLTLQFGSKLGGALTGIALIMASAVALIAIITTLGDEAKPGLIWTASILGVIIASAIVIQALMNSANSKLVDGKIKQSNPIAEFLRSISLILLSISASMFIISKIKFNKGLIIALAIVAAIIGVLILVAAKMQKLEHRNIIKSGKKSGVPAIMNSVAFLLISMAAVTAILSLLPDENRVYKTLAMVGGFLVAIMLVAALMAKVGKTAGGLAGLSGSLVLFAVSLAAISGALYLFQSMVKPDWQLYGYLAALLGLFLAIGALVGYLPVIAGGITLFGLALGVTFAALGAGMWVLGWGLSNLVGPMNELTAEGVTNLKNLLLWLSLTGLTGILGILGNSSLGVGMEVLGWGLKNLVGPMNELTAEGVSNLRNLLLWMSLIGLIGVLGALGNSSIGLGMYNLSSGLEPLVDPMNKLTSEGVTNLKNLLLWLSLTGFTGILGAFGNTFLGAGMASLAEGVSKLAPAMDMIKPNSAENLKNLLSIMSGGFGRAFTGFGQGFLSIFGASNGDKIRRGLEDLAYGLSPLIDQLNRISGSNNGIESLGKILDICSSSNVNVSNFKMIIDYIQKIVDMRLSDTDFTIRPLLDLSSFENGYNRLTNMLSSLSGKTVNLSTQLAGAVSAGLQSGSAQGSVTNNNNTSYNDSYNITMNIETNDPWELARKFNEIFPSFVKRGNSANGTNKI